MKPSANLGLLSLRLSVVAAILAIAVLLPAARAVSSPDNSGWRGGIGLACENPSNYIEDISELGYDICWAWDDVRVLHGLNIALFKYWNGIIETNLNGKDSASGTEGTWDFSGMADKNEAARLACDAMFERLYGIKGLSKYANISFRPKGFYQVGGSMDLSSDNPLVKAVEDTYLDWLTANGIRRGGIALDNATRLPKAFFESLSRTFNPRGFGVATNGARDELLPYIDFFGNEGFPFLIDYARQERKKGFHGILGEFAMQHLSANEMAAYIKNKHFNGIVFFGYLSGSGWIRGEYSRYDHRPDIYDHHRWVFRKYLPLVRSMRLAGRQEEAFARLTAVPASGEPSQKFLPLDVSESDPDGKVTEFSRPVATMERITGRTAETAPEIVRHGSDIGSGIYFYVDSGKPETVVCEADRLGVSEETIVFDEFNEKILPSTLHGKVLTFTTTEGPGFLALGSRAAVVRNVLLRSQDSLKTQLAQRATDRVVGKRYPRKAWETFCQGWALDSTVARSGKCSLNVEGRSFFVKQPQHRFFNRQGAAQLVTLDQVKPERITLKAASRAKDVEKANTPNLNRTAQRRTHFDVREAYTYCVHLYLDYQDGRWPEVHTATFKPGTHDWEEVTITVDPQRPVKTAQVLIEFQQPQGTAWFDDIVLTQADSGRNLLASGGFEENDPMADKAVAISPAYENLIGSLVEELGRLGSNPDRSAFASATDALNRAVRCIQEQEAVPYFGRELRDLADVRRKLALCAQLMTDTGNK